MLDRLKVRLVNPLIDPDNQLRIIPMATVGNVPGGSYMSLRYIDGSRVQVGSIYYKEEGLCTVTSYNGYIYVTFNLPRLKSGGRHNIWPVTQAEARDYITMLSRRMAEVGLVSDLNTAIVVNIELFANAATRYPFRAFRPLLELLDISRRTRAVYDGSYTFYNSQRKDIIYDKRGEQPEEIAKELPDHLLRYEYELLTDDAVEAVLGTKNLGQIIEGWDLLRAKYIARIREVLLSDSLKVEPSVQCNLDQLMGQKKRLEVLQSIGAVNLLKQFGSISAVRVELRRQGYKAWEIRAFLRKLKKYAAQNTCAEVSLAELRTELYTKLIEGLGGGEPEE